MARPQFVTVKQYQREAYVNTLEAIMHEAVKSVMEVLRHDDALGEYLQAHPLSIDESVTQAQFFSKSCKTLNYVCAFANLNLSTEHIWVLTEKLLTRPVPKISNA
jgi:hypothetical protein